MEAWRANTATWELSSDAEEMGSGPEPPEKPDGGKGQAAGDAPTGGDRGRTVSLCKAQPKPGHQRLGFMHTG